MKKICVIPAFNEEKTIAKVINDVKPFVDEIIVVDDCSGDKTFKIAHKENAIVLKHAINRGQGASLQTGNELALKRQADIIIHFDADDQFLAREIDDVVKPLLNNEVDVVFGSRFLGKASNIPWAKRKIILPIARIVNKTILNIDLTDPQSGFRAMNRKVAQDIMIQQDGMAHCSEIMYKVFKNNLRVKEVATSVIYHNFGQRFGGGIRIFKDLIISKFID